MNLAPMPARLPTRPDELPDSLKRKRDKLTADLEDAKADLDAAAKVARKTERAIARLLYERADEFIQWGAAFSDAAADALDALREPYAAAVAAWREAEAMWRSISDASGVGFVAACPLPDLGAVFATARAVPSNLAAADLRTVAIVVWMREPGGMLHALPADDVAGNSDMATRSDWTLVRGTPKLTEQAAEISTSTDATSASPTAHSSWTSGASGEPPPLQLRRARPASHAGPARRRGRVRTVQGCREPEAAERLPDLPVPYGTVADPHAFNRWADRHLRGPDIWGP
jgi:hypothetical protein